MIRKTAILIGLLALAGVITPPALYLAGRAELTQVKQAMLAATAVWFAAATIANRKQEM